MDYSKNKDDNIIKSGFIYTLFCQTNLGDATVHTTHSVAKSAVTDA